MSELALKLIAENKAKHARGEDARMLDLGNCGLTEVPEEVGDLVWLEELILRDTWEEWTGEEWEERESKNRGTMNYIKHLPKSLHLLSRLKKLLLGNSFAKGPLNDLSPIFYLHNLRVLFFSGTMVSDLSVLSKFKNISFLDCSNTLVSNLFEIKDMNSLEILQCEDTKIVDFSETIFPKGLRQIFLSSTITTESKQKIEVDLKSLGKVENIETLRIGNSTIHNLHFLPKFKKIKDLLISNSSICDLSWVKDLTELSHLFIDHNPISDIHPISKLDTLESLSVSGTKITEITAISNLLRLKYLDCSKTDVSDISVLTNLKQLSRIDFSHTKVSNIKPLLDLIKENIEVVTSESLSWIMANDASDHNLPGLIFKNCPLIHPPPEIVQQGNAAILEYFRQKEISGTAPLLEAKLILLGDGRSGKTSLANRLLGKPLPTEADRTQGVDIVIGAYEFEVANQQQFKLNIWDFAGQDKYKPLHQFFYTESSLYVMVADSGNTLTDFDDWLQTAELFGEGSPLVLVLNEFRDGIGFGSFDRDIWQKRFPSLLKEVFSVNLNTKRGFDALEHQLRLLAQSLPHTRYPYPKNWAAIRRELESRRDENFISFQEYLRICRDHQLPEKESALVLGQVLHKIGVCLHYQKSDLLKQVVILKNEWATEAVYKILDDATVAEQHKGFFDRADLERIWSDDAYCDMRPQLLELMQQFKMAYPLPGNQRFVTPPLLPPAPPTEWTWPAGDALELYIEYEFLPKALMTQFIVSRHPDIDLGKTLVWRNGVVLRWPGEALAEVLKTKLQGKDAFYIRSQGRDRKGLMTVILKTFRELHEAYKGVKFNEKVPCPCNDCQVDNNPHYFDFKNLKNRLEKGRSVECDKSLEILDPRKLLENHFVFEKMEAGQPVMLKRDLETPQATQKAIESMKKIFISYSKTDKTYLEDFKIQLASLRRQNLLETWDDTNLIAGQEWDATIRQELKSADIIVLLVSSNLMATDYIWDIEMKEALERHERSEATVIPVIIRPCVWEDAPFGKLNALPEKGKPIDTWNNKDEAWAQVVKKIKAVL